MRQRTAEVLEIVIKEHLVDNRFSIERDKVLEALGQNESKEAQEFLSHILNITSRTELNGKGYSPKLLPCAHYGSKHDIITLNKINNYKGCLEEKAKNVCPFYNNLSEDHCDYKGSK